MYRKNTFGFAIPHTAIMAGRVVVGPEIKKAKAAPGFIPSDNKPLIKGSAVRLLVYAGMPINVAIKIEEFVVPPNKCVRKSAGT